MNIFQARVLMSDKFQSEQYKTIIKLPSKFKNDDDNILEYVNMNKLNYHCRMQNASGRPINIELLKDDEKDPHGAADNHMVETLVSILDF